jgi:hypothetical protein
MRPTHSLSGNIPVGVKPEWGVGMKKTFEEFEQYHVQRHPKLTLPARDDERDVDDYEDFEDGEMLDTLWHQGTEQHQDELMAAEDY